MSFPVGSSVLQIWCQFLDIFALKYPILPVSDHVILSLVNQAQENPQKPEFQCIAQRPLNKRWCSQAPLTIVTKKQARKSSKTPSQWIQRLVHKIEGFVWEWFCFLSGDERKPSTLMDKLRIHRGGIFDDIGITALVDGAWECCHLLGGRPAKHWNSGLFLVFLHLIN
jgi:hypothetical protein